MAAYSAAIDASHTLTSATVDTVTLNADYLAVAVVNRGAAGSAEIWVRVDGVDPSVAGDDCVPVLAGTTVKIPTPNATTVVKLISSSAQPYTVEGAVL